MISVESLERPNIKDQTDLIRIHEMALPCSTPLLAGTPYLRRYYEFLINSPEERVIVARDQKAKALAAAVVTLSPQTFSRRVLVATCVPFVAGILKSVMLGPHWRRQRLARIFLEAFTHRESAKDSPELLYLYVSESSRSKGLGARLIGEIKDAVRMNGHDWLQVTTAAAGNNAALVFYERNGFNRRSTRKRLGQSLVVLDAQLNDSELSRASDG